MSKGWLIYHIIDVLRSTPRAPERDVYCPLWLAVFLGSAAGAFTITVLAHEAWRVFR